MDTNERVRYAVDKLGSLGLSKEQSYGVVGSLMGESGRKLNTGAFNPKDPGGGAFGIAQWHSERRTGLQKFAQQNRASINDFKTQMDYVAHELQTTHKASLQAVKATKTRAEAANVWTDKYERPNPKYANKPARVENADYAAKLHGSMKAAAVESATVSPAMAYVDPQVSTTFKQPTRPGQKQPATAADAIDAQAGAGQMKSINPAAAFSVDTSIGFPKAPTSGPSISGALNGFEKLFDLASGTPSSAAKSPREPGVMGVGKEFLTDVNVGAKLGAVVGGIFGGGAPGAIVGGLLGQGLGVMLGRMAVAQAEQLTPANGKDSGVSYNSLNDAGKDTYKSSQNFRDAVNSGKAGLW